MGLQLFKERKIEYKFGAAAVNSIHKNSDSTVFQVYKAICN